MPLPTPNDGESRDDFIGRCMGNPTAMDDFPRQDQRLAVCFRQWREAHGETRGAEVMEHKNLSQFETKNAESGEIEAVFATFNVVDKDGDITLPSAFDDGTEVLISAYGHESWTGALPVGRGTVKVTDADARLVGKFFMDTTHGRETFNTIRGAGNLQQYSYGFNIAEKIMPDDEGWEKEWSDMGARRALAKMHPYEVSPVLLGSGIDTHTVSLKDIIGEIPIRFHLEDDTKTETSSGTTSGNVAIAVDTTTVTDTTVVDTKQDDAPQALQLATDAPITDDAWDGPAEVAMMDAAKLRRSCLAFMGGDPDSKINYKLPYRDRDGRINANAVRNIMARLPQTNLPSSVKGDVQRNAQRLMDLVQERNQRAAEATRKAAEELEAQREAEIQAASKAEELQEQAQEEWLRLRRNIKKSGRKL